MTEIPWLQICNLSDLTDRSRLGRDVQGEPVLLIRTGDEVFAYEDRCPHKGAPLSDGPLGKSTITCRHHQWHFDIRTGKSTRPPGFSLKSYEVKIENNLIYVRLS